MPFIARTLEEHTGPGNGLIRTPYRGHVPEADLLATDRIVEPTAEELEALQAQFPDEYGTPTPPFVFADANATEAIAAVEASNDLEQLAEWFEIELAGAKRKTVIAAFATKGLTATGEPA